MVTVAEAVRGRVEIADRRLPTGLESYPHATLAWRVWVAISKRRQTSQHAGEFEPMDDDGRAGWKWEGGSVAALARELNEGSAAEYLQQQVRKFLTDTGNLATLRGGAHPHYWVSDEWQDANPGTLARLAATRRQRDEQKQGTLVAAAPPEPAAGLDPDGDYGVIGTDQFSAACRWCPEIARLQDPGALAGLRTHEREDHPAEFWAVTTHLCVSGSPPCDWAAPSEEAYEQHLISVHRTMLPPARRALISQAAARAASLRPAPAAVPAAPVVPAAVPAVPEPEAAAPEPASKPAAAPAPVLAAAAEPAKDEGITVDTATAAVDVITRFLAQAAQVDQVRAERDAAEKRAKAAETRLALTQKAVWGVVSIAEGEASELPVAVGQ